MRTKQQGYSLLEVLIGILILSVGILGMAAMQLSAKKVGYDALQRSIATSLAHDILERIRSNPTALTRYEIANTGDGTTAAPTPDCTTGNVCSDTQLADRDLWEWEQSLIGVAEQSSDNKPVGGLVNPRACITETNGLVVVTIVWKGFQSSLTNAAITCGAGLGLYGTDDEERQMITFTTFVAGY
jgi:type IV pilus assembly protein PilV